MIKGSEVPVMPNPLDADRLSSGGFSGPGHSGTAPTNDAFHLYREVDRLDRSVESNARRIDLLDQHGSRGVDSLKSQVEQIRRDIEEHEKAHVEAAKQLATNRRWLIGTVVAMVTPLYPLIISLLVK